MKTHREVWQGLYIRESPFQCQIFTQHYNQILQRPFGSLAQHEKPPGYEHGV